MHWLHTPLDLPASPLTLSSKSAPEGSHPVILVVDSALSKLPADAKLAFHAGSATDSVAISAADFNKFVESNKIETQHVDFVELKTKTPAPAAKQPAASKPAAAPSASKASAKIEDAELIGITVRKAGDFPEWYQQVLRKGDMLDYYDVSGCYILKPWSYAVWEAIQGEYMLAPHRYSSAA